MYVSITHKQIIFQNPNTLTQDTLARDTEAKLLQLSVSQTEPGAAVHICSRTTWGVKAAGEEQRVVASLAQAIQQDCFKNQGPESSHCILMVREILACIPKGAAA